MFTPEGLADALKHSRRKLRSIRPENLADDHWRLNAILDARPASAPQPAFNESALSNVFLERAPKAPERRQLELTPWQALRRLFNQEWMPPGPEDRRLRISAGFISLLMNLFFFSMLLWLMYWKFVMPPRPDAEESIRVQIMGAGAPQEEGGAPEQVGDIQVASAHSQAAKSAANAPASNAMAKTAPIDQVQENIEATSVSVSQPALNINTEVSPRVQPVEQPVEAQPIIASKPVQTQSDYRVPDVKSMPLPTQRPVEMKAEALPEVAAIPMPAEPEPAVPRVSMLNARIAPITRAPRTLQVSDLSGALKSLPNPAPSVGSSDGKTDASSNANASSSDGKQNATVNAAPATAVGNKQGVASKAQGAGASNLPKQGSVPTPVLGDDWGDAQKNVTGVTRGGTQGKGNGKSNGVASGNVAGVYNPDGSVRLPDQFKAKPPDPYKEGSWMKRPGLVVQDTVFSKYWRPPETLLEDWVRRGIKAISIPIPGTNLVLNCQVSLLQLGGGCVPGSGKNGPRDQPSSARPPPDIPFKRELFEDPSVLGPPKAHEK